MRIVRVDNMIIIIKPSNDSYVGIGNATHVCFSLDNRERWASGNSERGALLNFLEMLDTDGTTYFNGHKAN